MFNHSSDLLAVCLNFPAGTRLMNREWRISGLIAISSVPFYVTQQNCVREYLAYMFSDIAQNQTLPPFEKCVLCTVMASQLFVALLQWLRGFRQSWSEGWNLFIRAKLQLWECPATLGCIMMNDWNKNATFPFSLLYAMWIQPHQRELRAWVVDLYMKSDWLVSNELGGLSSSCVFLGKSTRQNEYTNLLRGDAWGSLSGE